jgi:hypothetical protein
MKTYGGVEVELNALFTSEIEGSERSASRFSRFIPGEGAPGTRWIGGWVGPRFGLDAVPKRKLNPSSTCLLLNPGHPTRHLITTSTCAPPTKHHAMKAHWGIGGAPPPLL